MKLILLRHGLQNKDPSFQDYEAPLSQEGKLQQEATNLLIKSLSLHPKVIYTSPLTRAYETAKMLQEISKASLYKEDALGIHFEEDRLLRILEETKEEIVCFVGHVPTLTEFARRLVSDHPIPDLSRSSAVVLEIKNKKPFECSFYAYITPKGVTF